MTEPDQPRYRAFISYSHADQACAGWLHRALESYRIPAKLVGRETPVGAVPARLTPIFKDRDELPASGDLTNELRAALASSQFLIVIASPAAAQSRWVNEEIRAFKQSRREARVLVLIADGEPGMSAVPAREAEECFPEALRRRVDPDGTITDAPAEPIAADLRPQGDGKRLAKLKLVAGLTGLELDALVQREAQRRARRMTALTAFATIVAMIMTTLSVVALRARNEAEHQRAEADGLVEYMLTDLRGKLEPVGRLDVLDSVGARALKYYAGQSPGDLDANALGRRARALHLVGEVANLRGKLDDALKVFRQAADTTAEQLRRDPDNGQRIFDHAQSVYWVGYIAWQQGANAEAERFFLDYLGLAKRLESIDPNNPGWRAEVEYANHNLGVLYVDLGRPTEAVDRFRAALAVSTRLAELSPNDSDRKWSLAQTHAWLADALRMSRNYDSALSHRAREISLYQSVLATDPNNSKAKEGLSVAWMRSAQLHLESGAPDKASTLSARSLSSIKALHEQDPSNQLWQEMAAKSANLRAELLMATSDWQGARDANLWALGLAHRLVATDASVIAWRSECLMPARWMEIAITRALEDRASARQKIEAFEREFANAAKPKSDEERFAWIMVHILSGVNWQSLGNNTKANASFARAIDLLPQDTSLADTRLAAAASFLREAAKYQGKSTGIPASQVASRYNLRALLFNTAGR